MRRGTQQDPDSYLRSLHEAYDRGVSESMFELDRLQVLGSGISDQYWMGRRHGAELLGMALPVEDSTGETSCTT